MQQASCLCIVDVIASLLLTVTSAIGIDTEETEISIKPCTPVHLKNLAWHVLSKYFMVAGAPSQTLRLI